MQSKIIAMSVVLFGLLAASAFGVFSAVQPRKPGRTPTERPSCFGRR